MERMLWSLLSVAVLIHNCESYKILVVFPLPGKSHGILGFGVVNHLLNHGHEVTYITPFVKQNLHPNLRQIDISKNIAMLEDNSMDIKSLIENNDSQIDSINMLFFTTMITSATLKNENVQMLMKDPKEKFDLVIIEWLFSELLVGLAAALDAPFAWLSSIEPHWLITRLIDESLNPAYNNDILSVSIPPHNFIQRVKELWAQIRVMFYFYTLIDEGAAQEYEKIIAPIIRQKGREPPAYEELKFNASLVLGNSHVALGQATRLPQNYKPIAGYHIDEDVKPLPKHLQKIMDEAKHGVIYFSLGSNINSTDLPEEIQKSLLKMFGTLKQTVLWKFEAEITNLPKNIHILDWAPQQSILSHPNCVIFISHGGLLSTTEAVHFGVPIIGIPVFGDQFINVERAVSKGYGKRVDLSYSMDQKLKTAISEILENPSYVKTVKELSFLFHHRPVRPGAELVHWVEHVIQTNGAPHLKSLALRVPWYQKMYLDLAALVIFLIIVIVIVLKRLIKAYFWKPKVRENKKSN